MTDDAPAEGPPVERPSDGADPGMAARVGRLLEVVQRFALLDFSDVATVGDAGDDLDALAAGINMLGEELDGWNRDFHRRVVQQTTELNESVRQLQRFNDQISKLTEMSSLLQTAIDREEAFHALGRFAPEIFSGASGAVYAYGRSLELVEATARWGPHQAWLPSEISSDECCALRDGVTHGAHGPEADCCHHLPPELPGHTLCVPFVVDGATLGLMSLHEGRDATQQPADRPDVRGPIVPSAHERLAQAASEQFSLAVANLELRNELRDRSIRDALTGLYNRRYLDEVLARELHRASRTGTPVSVLMLDIDHFKDLNDTHGHAAGDAVLAEMAAAVLSSIRTEDVACRYGGEEFVVVMAGLDPVEAVERAEQIRARIALHGFGWDGQSLGPLTISIGVATAPQHGSATDQLLGAADTALYRAKGNGRNRVESAT